MTKDKNLSLGNIIKTDYFWLIFYTWFVVILRAALIP